MYIYLIVKLVIIAMFIGYLLSVISYTSNEVFFFNLSSQDLRYLCKILIS